MTREQAVSWLDAHAKASPHVVARHDAEILASDLRFTADIWALRAWARAEIKRLRTLRDMLGEERFAARLFTPVIVLRVEVDS